MSKSNLPYPGYNGPLPAPNNGYNAGPPPSPQPTVPTNPVISPPPVKVAPSSSFTVALDSDKIKMLQKENISLIKSNQSINDEE
tara:strand:+ start:1377 stop:1628 length:252 start_codon:yes stop_codon:yes gene_type:complete